ncbi:hypothetical protein [Bacillus dakarensis]|uniref:hypothetical protein n=1 Tax=Robertmurraya dakarensis TaxID=1926278 RepID=UPI000980FA84|nr:hypothetical protein [Bacillus dakarensis]
MNKKILLSGASVMLSLGLLSACGVDNNGVETDGSGTHITPVRYDRQNNNGVFDNDLRNNNVDPVRYDTDENGMFNNNNRGLDGHGTNNNRYNGNNDDGLFDVNNDRDNNDLFDNDDNNRGLFNIDNDRDNDLFDNDVDNDLLKDNGRRTRQVDPGTQGNVDGRS